MGPMPRRPLGAGCARPTRSTRPTTAREYGPNEEITRPGVEGHLLDHAIPDKHNLIVMAMRKVDPAIR